MKKPFFVQRLRHPSGEQPSLRPPRDRRPFRLWMTGSLAVVMAALIPIRDVAETDRSGTMRVLRHSRFGVGETLQRIEAAARDAGLSVLAVMPGNGSMLVLASSVGGTPVVMEEADSHPAMPMSLMVCAGSAGGADVLVAAASDSHARHDWQDVPAEVVRDLRALPELIDRALA